MGEPSFAQQLAEVRAGNSDEIRVSEQLVRTSHVESLIAGDLQLRVLHVESHEVTPAFFQALSQIAGLTQLRLGGAIDDAAIAELTSLSGLEVLNIPRGTFSDEGLEQLRALESLELLRFGSPNVTDAGMVHVAALPRLRFLHLLDPPISDAGLEHLVGMKQLESLYVDGTDCTEEGLQALLEELPRLHLHYNDHHVNDDADHVH